MTPQRPAAPATHRTRGRAAARRHEESGAGIALPGAIGLGVAAAWAALLLLAPPESNAFWAVNGVRSLPGAAVAGLLAAAILAALLPFVRTRAATVWGAVGVALAAMVAFPLREKIHLLGDTDLRLHVIAGFDQRAPGAPLSEWAARLHANPLDLLVNVFGPVGLTHVGMGLTGAVSLTGFLIAVLYVFGAWRVSARLGAAPELRGALCAALVLTGALQAFAGYAESMGLLLALAMVWWAELLAPLDRPRQALRVAAAWLLAFLAHRLALTLLLPQLWRAFGPPLPGDDPAARRRLALLTGADVLVAIALLPLGVGGGRLTSDLSEMVGGLGAQLAAFPLHDLANSIALLAPLAVLGAALAVGDGWRAFVRRPHAALAAVAIVPLVPLLLLVPDAPSGLGYFRDWDLSALFGQTMTVGAALLLASLDARRLRGALMLALPLLAVGAGGWVGMNAHEGVSVRRALVLASRPPLPPGPQLAQLHVWLGQRAWGLSQFELAARYYDRAFELTPSPRHALLAAEAWVRAGHAPEARASLAKARSRGTLSPDLERSIPGLETSIAAVEAQGARAARSDSAAADSARAHP